MTTRTHDDLLALARIERERDDLREATVQARRHVQHVLDALTFGDVAGEQLREAYGAAEDAMVWLNPETEEKLSSTTVRRPPGWLVAGTTFGWFGAVTFAVTAWGGMPWPSEAGWIYSVGMLGAFLLGGWLWGSR